MTEREWLTASDPEKMLARLGNQVSTRKLRLFACTGLRRYRNLLKDENSKRGLRVAERYADGQVSLVEMQEAHDAVLCYLPCITAQEAARSAVFGQPPSMLFRPRF
jgi:hypothetical protein